MNHMKKFIAYMLLAGVVYLGIYAALLGYMHVSTSNVREFCEQLEPGMELKTIEALAGQQGFESALRQLPDNQTDVIFISTSGNKDATCQGIIKNNALFKQKFVLSVF